MGENIEYKRTQDFGCCQEEKTNVTLIVVICVAAVVVIGAVVAVIVVMNKKKTNLPKKPTVSCVCYKERMILKLELTVHIQEIPLRSRAS